MFGDLQPIMKATFSLLRDQYEERIKECHSEIASQKRKIKKNKSIITYFHKIEKELKKPPKPFKPVKLTRAQRKAYGAPGVFVAPARKLGAK